jgi:NAD(P)-dependent dehydrogenase (short-subunit alcohol dehydrogenase family)
MDLGLSGRVAWVTGCSGGIGGAVASALKAEGVRVLGTGTASHPPSEALVDQYKRCDLATAGDIDVTVAYCLDIFGRIDIFINNAAIVTREPVLKISPDNWKRTLDVNLTGAFFAARAAAEGMIQSGNGGVIINVSSVNGVHPNPETLAYSVSKAGMNSLTVGLAAAFGPHGIRVNAVAPFGVVSPMTKSWFDDPEQTRLVDASTLLGRHGVADDVAGAVTYLVSDRASYITGAILPINGGWPRVWSLTSRS